MAAKKAKASKKASKKKASKKARKASKQPYKAPVPVPTVAFKTAGFPYEQLERETIKNFEAFSVYRDMGAERSMGHVARRLRKSVALMSRWSSQFSWVRRAIAWDVEIDRRKRIAELSAVESMHKRQIAAGRLMQDIAVTEYKRLAARLKETQDAGEALTPKDVVKLMEAGAKLERINRGEPGEVVHTMGTAQVDVSPLSKDQLRALREMRRQVTTTNTEEPEA